LNRLSDPEKLSPAQRIGGAMLMFTLTLVGWAIFRSDDLTQLTRWFAALGNWHSDAATPWIKPALWWLLHVVPLLLLQAATWKARDEMELDRFSWPVRGLIYTLLFLLVTGSVAPDVEFIYFQF
jgi:hypothetical protein